MAGDPEDDDPIVASYSVFLNGALPMPHRRLLVLKQPARKGASGGGGTSSSSSASVGAGGGGATPTEVRVKARTGMVEVDFAMDATDGPGYDRARGLHWGTVLRQSLAAKGGGSHGVAGGFSVIGSGGGATAAGGGGGGGGGGAAGGRGKARVQVGLNAADEQAIAEADNLTQATWNRVVAEDKVLRTQTLGGEDADQDDWCKYMVGVFQGSGCTSLSNVWASGCCV